MEIILSCTEGFSVKTFKKNKLLVHLLYLSFYLNMFLILFNYFWSKTLWNNNVLSFTNLKFKNISFLQFLVSSKMFRSKKNKEDKKKKHKPMSQAELTKLEEVGLKRGFFSK